MIKTILLFIIGLILGSGIILGIAVTFYGFKVPSIQKSLLSMSTTPQTTTETPTPTGEVKPSPQAGKMDEQTLRENLNKLQKQIYTEGITVNATVDQVFPGKGFIAKDESGVKLFVHWTKIPPTVDQKVTFKGTLKRLAEQNSSFQQEVSSPQALVDFLKDQKLFIEAQEVTIA